MTVNFSLPQQAQIIDLLESAADAAGRTSATYVSMTNAQKAYIVCRVSQGHAATAAFTPLQGTSAAKAGSKAITACPIWSNLDTATSDALVSRTAAANYTVDAALKNKMVVFEIDPGACMDINNGFNHIGVSTGASNALNLTSALLILMPIKDRMATPPTTTSV